MDFRVNIGLKFLGIFNAMSKLRILGDSPTTEDGLGFKSYVGILFDAINNFDAENPLTIGIHGSWGSGKTSLMKMLEKKFEGDDSVKTIWFNAWAQGKEESIGLALLQLMLIKFQDEEQNNEKIINVSKSLSKLLADAALRKISGITLEEAKEHFKDSIEAKSTLRDDFEKVIGECLPVKRLVVFIDDLDRCLPEKTIEILEVIKLFLDVPKCVFVIGVAREVIERGIEIRYKTDGQLSITGKDYIEKIIQVPFTLPLIREKDMIEYIGKLGINEDEKEYAEIVAKGTGSNPRKVKMFLNTLRIRQAIAKSAGGGIKPELSAKLFVIEYTFPKFYEDVVKYREQDLLCTLEKLVKGEADEELRKELEGSELRQKYYKNEDLKSLLKTEPFFCGIDIEPYIYGAKVPEVALVFDESVLNDLLSGDRIKIEHAESVIKDMPESDKEQYLDIVTSKLEDTNKYVRLRAVKALGVIGDTKAVKLLIKALKDEYEGVRTLAARGLGNIGDPRAVELLIEALKDKSEHVRADATVSLGRIRDVKAVEPLIEVLKDDNEYMHDKAAWALGNVGDPKAVEPLIEALKDTNTNVRWRATGALGRIGDSKAVVPLGEVLNDKSEYVRKSAKEALEKIQAKQN